MEIRAWLKSGAAGLVMPPRWGGRHEAATPELAEALEELSRHEKVTATMEAELRHLQAATAHALRESQGAAAQAEEVRAEAAAVLEKLQGASDGRAGRSPQASPPIVGLVHLDGHEPNLWPSVY